MLTQNQAARVLKLAAGSGFAEVYAERTRSRFFTLEDGRPKNLASGSIQGTHIRVRRGDTDHSFIVSEINFSRIYPQVKTWAREIGFAGARIIDFISRTSPSYNTCEIHPESVSLDKKLDILRRADEAARSFDSRIVQVEVWYQEIQKEVLLANSEGLFDADWRSRFYFLVFAVGKQGDLLTRAIANKGENRGWEFFAQEGSPEKIAGKAASLAILQLEAEPASAGDFTVVLGPGAGGVMIHEAVGHGLEADQHGKNSSVYAGKIGQKVASELISVCDDGTMLNQRGTEKFDDEGWPTQKVLLIENGVLRGLLADKRWAEKLGLPRTGNGRRESYKHLPICRMRNTLILPGKTDPKEILASVKKGLYIKKVASGEVDPITGNFTFYCDEVYWIQDGQIGNPVRDVSLIGNGPKVLEEIDMVGNDIDFGVGICGKGGRAAPVSHGAPTLRIPKIRVGGEK